MGITTHNGHARQSSALLWAYHMYNALALILHFKFGNTKLITIVTQGHHLNLRYRVGNTLHTNDPLVKSGRYVMIWGGQVSVNAPWLAACNTQALEGLG